MTKHFAVGRLARNLRKHIRVELLGVAALLLPLVFAGTFALGQKGDSSATVYFHVKNGKILGPEGHVFIARGINVYAAILSRVVTGPSSDPLVSTFPGINMIRLNAFAAAYGKHDLNTKASTSELQPLIQRLSSHRVVVEIEIHDYPKVLSGSELSRVAKWFSSLASAFRNNPYVWFGTQNEPDSKHPSGIMKEQQAIYNAVRNAGNNTIVMMDAGGAHNTKGLDPSMYAGMKNIVWDAHYYNWMSKYSSDLAVNQHALAKEIQNMEAIKSADGTIPVIVGEYGDSTDGTRVDPGWRQVIRTVTGSGYGFLAWAWESGGKADMLLNPPYHGGPGDLTAYGRMVARAIASGANSGASAGSQ